MQNGTAEAVWYKIQMMNGDAFVVCSDINPKMWDSKGFNWFEKVAILQVVEHPQSRQPMMHCEAMAPQWINLGPATCAEPLVLEKHQQLKSQVERILKQAESSLILPGM